MSPTPEERARLREKAAHQLDEHHIRPIVSQLGSSNGYTACLCRDCKLAAGVRTLLAALGEVERNQLVQDERVQQLEAERKDVCDAYGLPASYPVLRQHIDANQALVNALDKRTIADYATRVRQLEAALESAHDRLWEHDLCLCGGPDEKCDIAVLANTQPVAATGGASDVS